MAILRWSCFLQNKKVIIYTDNMTAKSVINKMSSKNPSVMTYIRFLFFMQAFCNFSILVIHIPGKRNIIADSISRLHEDNKLSEVYALLPSYKPFTIFELLNHMSFIFLFSRWLSGWKHPRKGCG